MKLSFTSPIIAIFVFLLALVGFFSFVQFAEAQCTNCTHIEYDVGCGPEWAPEYSFGVYDPDYYYARCDGPKSGGNFQCAPTEDTYWECNLWEYDNPPGDNPQEADCSGGTHNWGGGCTATLDGTLPHGATQTFPNENTPDYEGETTFRCDDGIPIQDGPQWCNAVITGCTNPASTNYDPDATVSDGSCNCPFSGTYTWDGGNCSVTTSVTLSDGQARTFYDNTGAYTGSTRWSCDNGSLNGPFGENCDPVPVDCSGSWSSYSSCSAKPGETCGDGNGTRSRTYSINTPASNGGASCPYPDGYVQTQDCDLGACTPDPVNCSGSWSSYSSCSAKPGETCGDGNGTRSRTYSVNTPASGGGASCPYPDGYVQTQDCDLSACTSDPVNCSGSWSNTGSCTPDYPGACGSGNGERQQTYSITTPAQNGGTSCPYTNGATRMVSCNPGACTAPTYNLNAVSINHTSGDLENSATINLRGNFRNNGSSNITSSFQNIFEYRFGNSGGFSAIGTRSHSSISSGSSRNDYQSLTLPSDASSRGDLWIQYCTDHGNNISESIETVSDNCISVNLGSVSPGAVTTQPDLEPIVAASDSSVTVDTSDNTYDNMIGRLIIENTGSGDLQSYDDVDYEFRLDYNQDGIVDDTRSGTYNGSLAGGGSQSAPVSRSFNNVPVGTHEMCVVISSTADTNSSNNEDCTTFTLNSIPPTLDITANGEDQTLYIRRGEDVNVVWDVQANDAMTCEVFGKGGRIYNYTFPSTGGSDNGSTLVQNITNSTTFTLTCDSGTYSESATVEVIPTLEEI